MGITIDQTVKPVAQAYRPVPVPLGKAVEKKIDLWIKRDIIEAVAISRWISPLVVVPKKDGDVRLCVDMRRANKAIVREKFVMPTIENLLPLLNNCNYFAKLDIKDAFHQLELAEWCRYITTFITKRGLYRFKRLMFGLSCAPEIFQKTIQRMLIGLKGVFNYMDDIIIFASTKDQLKCYLKEVLLRLKSFNVVLNDEKCVYLTEKLDFLGHEISSKGIEPSETKLESIEKCKSPGNKEELQSFLGLIVYVGSRFIPNLATLTEPLRLLTKKDSVFKWTDTEQKAFNEVKIAMKNNLLLGFFSPEKRTQLYTDASPVGLGAVLIQWSKDGHQIVACASKTLTDVEKRYCQTEKEALGIVWGVERFKMYLIGLEFELLTDHRPLEAIFGPNSRPCARIERWVLRLQSFTFKVIYIPGKNNIADSLSRLCQNQPSYTEVDQETEEYVLKIALAYKPIALSQKLLEKESLADKEISEIKKALQDGNWTEHLKRYKLMEIELCTIGNLLTRGRRLIIPESLKSEVLKLGHEGHPGIQAMKNRLRAKVWWLGMDKDIDKHIKSCRGCVMVGPTNCPEPMVRRKLPIKAWEDLAVDFLGPLPSDEYLLVVVDYYSRFMEVVIMKSITTSNTIKEINTIFIRFGIPRTISADNGPQFRSEEFKTYCENEGIQLNLTIPYWPQMNGEVERQNRTILKRLRIAETEGKNWKEELDKFLLMHRATPHAVTGKSPSELLFGWNIRDKIPSLSENIPKVNDEEVRDADAWKKEKGRQYGDLKRNASEGNLEVGDIVLAKLMHKRNKLSANFEDNEYIVKSKNLNDVTIENIESGKLSRRSASHLKKIEKTKGKVDPPENTNTGDAESNTSTPRPVRQILKPKRYQ